jgi:hypothetical protein
MVVSRCPAAAGHTPSPYGEPTPTPLIVQLPESPAGDGGWHRDGRPVGRPWGYMDSSPWGYIPVYLWTCRDTHPLWEYSPPAPQAGSSSESRCSGIYSDL